MPTRGLLGLRNAVLTASRGTAILNTIFEGYEPWAGDINTRELGSLVRILLSVPRTMFSWLVNCGESALIFRRAVLI